MWHENIRRFYPSFSFENSLDSCEGSVWVILGVWAAFKATKSPSLVINKADDS